jgi:16S rRNA (cytosine1402-N4)-methyltransferase
MSIMTVERPQSDIPSESHSKRPGDPHAALSREQAFHHVSVMLDEVIEWFRPVPAGWIVDTTLGGAGHSRALLEQLPHISILGIDQDPLAITVATERLRTHHDRVRIVRSRFDRIAEVVAETKCTPIVGVLMDLGVSSAQFDIADRGFSYRSDAPLDMRMDPTTGPSATDLLAELDEHELTQLLRDFGDERFAHRIARSVVARRRAGAPITTTAELVEVVTAAIPAATRRTGGHPAKRTFQALRIAVNQELDVLGPTFETAIELLAPLGRLVVLSYHSGEDRIVKERLRYAETGGCTCPAGLPCTCGQLPQGRPLKRGVVRPSAAEVASNPRSASALARVFEKTLASPQPSNIQEPS